MVASGMPIYDIASHLGHSYDETVNRYSHMQPGVIARSAALIDSAVAPAPFAALANDPRDALVTPAAGEASEPDADEVS